MRDLGAPSTSILVNRGAIKLREGLSNGVTVILGDDVFIELPVGGLERLEFAIAQYRARRRLMADIAEAAGQPQTTTPGATA